MPDSIVGSISLRLFTETMGGSSDADRLMLLAAHREGFSLFDRSRTAEFLFAYFTRLGWTPDRIKDLHFRDAAAAIEGDGWEPEPDGLTLGEFELVEQCKILCDTIEHRLGVDDHTAKDIEACGWLARRLQSDGTSAVIDRLLAALDRANAENECGDNEPRWRTTLSNIDELPFKERCEAKSNYFGEITKAIQVAASDVVAMESSASDGTVLENQPPGTLAETDETTTIANTTNTPRIFVDGVPNNLNVADLITRLDAAAGSGRPKLHIAREFTGGNESKAKSLLADINRRRRNRKLSI